MPSSLRRLIVLFWLPGLLLLVHAAVRVKGGRPTTDLDGTSAVLRIGFLAFGASIAYFMTLLPERVRLGDSLRTSDSFWTLVAAWFVVMLVDDSFMVHEGLGKALGIQDSIPLVVLGCGLIALVVTHRQRLKPPFWLGLLGFGTLSCVSLAGDILSGREGILNIGSRGFDYEQTAETLAVLCLAAGFAAQALGEIAAQLLPARIGLSADAAAGQTPSLWRSVVRSLRSQVAVPGPRLPVSGAGRRQAFAPDVAPKDGHALGLRVDDDEVAV